MPKKILIIDDDKTNVALVKSRLEMQNYQVVVALDGDVGLEKVRKEKPDLIILDIEMPRMNGYIFLTELKKDKEFKNLDVIVLTAQPTMEPIFNLKGIKGYLVKPLVAEVLLDKIKNCLGPVDTAPKAPATFKK